MAVGTAHHRFTMLRPAAVTAAAVRRLPGARVRGETSVPVGVPLLITMLSTEATVRTSEVVRHCRKSNLRQ